MSIKPLKDPTVQPTIPPTIPNWTDSLADLPKVGDTSWAENFADYYADMISEIEPDPTVMIPLDFTFTFNKDLFKSNLILLAPTPNALAGITGFANAWSAAVLATVVVVGTNTVYGSPATNANTFSAVTTSLINPASIAAGQAIILTLATDPPVGDTKDSKFPEKFRNATLALKIDVTGLDSTPTPAGPLPLVALLVPLV
jgi:hypothetical protein